MKQQWIRIHVMRCGIVGTDETIPDKSKSRNPFAYTGVFRGRRHKVWLPVYTYLIEHPKGRILVDTGWHIAVRTAPQRHLSWKLSLTSQAVLPEGEAVTEQLAKIGYTPSDLDFVLLTHLDVDHASGIELVKGAKKIYANDAELNAVHHGASRYRPQLWDGISIVPIPMQKWRGLPHGSGFDVFGDQTVLFVDFSGHSDGMTGVWIRNHGKSIILTGDACYNRQSWEQLRLPGITTDRKKAMRSIRWIAQQAKNPGCQEILATHDPEILPHITEL